MWIEYLSIMPDDQGCFVLVTRTRPRGVDHSAVTGRSSSGQIYSAE